MKYVVHGSILAEHIFLSLISRSRETYAMLFEVMDTQKLVMRIYFDGVDGVDLLIFTSKQLHFHTLSKTHRMHLVL